MKAPNIEAEMNRDLEVVRECKDYILSEDMWWSTKHSACCETRKKYSIHASSRSLSEKEKEVSVEEVMGFLGKKLVGQFRGEVVSDMTDRGKRRLPGIRVKHRAKMNWIKMYDKAGSVLRVETVINQSETFKVRKQSAKISRLLKRLHIYSLVAKIPPLPPLAVNQKRLGIAQCCCIFERTGFSRVV